MQCPITVILIDQEPLTMLHTETRDFNNISVMNHIDVVYQINKLIILLLIGDSVVKFLNSKQLQNNK